MSEAVAAGGRTSRSDFVHLAELGKGACGTVSKVSHAQTGEIFALKAISRRHTAEHRLQAYVDFEVEAQRSLDHPNIVKLLDSFEDTDSVYLLLEFAVGGQLFSLIRSHERLEEHLASRIFSDVASALLYLHAQSIAHRDLKPENVLLFKNNLAKLADFGWCASTRSDTGRKTFCGTPDYLSPEMVAGKPHDHRVDTWAAGVLLYEMLVGSAPFAARHVGDSIRRILDADVRPPPAGVELAPEAFELVRALLQVDPAARISLEAALSHRWMRRLQTSRVEASLLPTSQEHLLDLSTTLPVPALPALAPAVLSAGRLVEVTPLVDDGTTSALAAPLGAAAAAEGPGQPAPTHGSSPAAVQEAGDLESTAVVASASEPLDLLAQTAAVPRIGGLATLEGLSGTRRKAAVAGHGACDGVGAALEDSWSGSQCNSTARERFALGDCCLRPVSSRFAAASVGEGGMGASRSLPCQGEASALRGWASAARPARAFSGEVAQRPAEARGGAAAPSWKDSDTFAAVRSWVRAKSPPRRALAAVLDGCESPPASSPSSCGEERSAFFPLPRSRRSQASGQQSPPTCRSSIGDSSWSSSISRSSASSVADEQAGASRPRRKLFADSAVSTEDERVDPICFAEDVGSKGVRGPDAALMSRRVGKLNGCSAPSPSGLPGSRTRWGGS